MSPGGVVCAEAAPESASISAAIVPKISSTINRLLMTLSSRSLNMQT